MGVSQIRTMQVTCTHTVTCMCRRFDPAGVLARVCPPCIIIALGHHAEDDAAGAEPTGRRHTESFNALRKRTRDARRSLREAERSLSNGQMGEDGRTVSAGSTASSFSTSLSSEPSSSSSAVDLRRNCGRLVSTYVSIHHTVAKNRVNLRD